MLISLHICNMSYQIINHERDEIMNLKFLNIQAEEIQTAKRHRVLPPGRTDWTVRNTARNSFVIFFGIFKLVFCAIDLATRGRPSRALISHQVCRQVSVIEKSLHRAQKVREAIPTTYTHQLNITTRVTTAIDNCKKPDVGGSELDANL